MARSTRRVVPPVGGAPSGHTSTWQVQAAGVHRPSDRRGGEAEWHPEASSRGDAKQPRRRARRAGALTRGGIFVPPGECVSRFEIEGFRSTSTVEIYFLARHSWTLLGGFRAPSRALVTARS
jgi:hypothetical protein